MFEEWTYIYIDPWFQVIHKWRNMSGNPKLNWKLQFFDLKWKFQYFMADIERTGASSELGFEMRYY